MPTPPPDVRNALLDDINAFLTLISPFGEDFSFDTLTLLINKFTSFLKALETYVTSVSFPNVNRSPYDEKLLYIRNGLMHALPGSSFMWNEIPKQPTLLVVGNELKYRKGFGNLGDVKARHILNNVSGFQGNGVRLGVKKSGGSSLIPYAHAVRIDPRNRVSPTSYWTGSTWSPHDREILGTLRLVNGQVLQKQLGETGKVWQGINLPRQPGDLHSGSVFPVAEGDVRAKSGDVGLQVYRGGSWQDLWIF